jgi:hypothetical protein
MAQQAYCTAAHGAILVTLLGPIPRRFHTGVGLLATRCYKAENISVQPATHQTETQVIYGISSYTLPLSQLFDHITICSHRHKTECGMSGEALRGAESMTQYYVVRASRLLCLTSTTAAV